MVQALAVAVYESRFAADVGWSQSSPGWTFTGGLAHGEL
jgi:hypothetical protein